MSQHTVYLFFSVYIKCSYLSFISPQNKQELFNLRHAQAQNVIERIFGVLKCRFRILLLVPEYTVYLQSRIPSALAALHNFIQIHDPAEKIRFASNDTYDSFSGVQAGDDFSSMHIEEEQNPTGFSLQRDRIADAMWHQYQQVLQERAAAGQLEDENSDYDDEDANNEDTDNQDT